VIGRVDLDDCLWSVSLDEVGVGAGGVGAAAKDGGLGEELDAEAGGGREDACMRMPGGVGGPLSPSLNMDFSRSVCIVCTPTPAPLDERFSAGQVARLCAKVVWGALAVPGT
jgi:hypothetical protein